MTKLWMRHEQRLGEHRAPLVPADVAELVRSGVEVTVEHSPHRIFPLEDYLAAGATTAPAGSWRDADTGWYVLGIKELPDSTEPLIHRHIMFGHAFHAQRGAEEFLGRFVAGGGALLDLESLVDADGRRLVAFGYWAGYVGAALAVLHHHGSLPTPLRPTTRTELDAALHASPADRECRALVVGALGRCGRGARDALAVAGVSVTPWDVDETRCLDRPALLAHDLLVNAVATDRPLPPLVRPLDLAAAHRSLSTIADVTCDVTSDRHLLPVYDQVTTWAAPVRRVTSGPHPVDVIAIDNLPSLLPAEASVAFSASLAPLIIQLDDLSSPWGRALRTFQEVAYA